ncbi:MAG: hypothetical protein IMW89_06625 [Ktedonobacteraceae bacterium]|nr:hypothetical protein [Ktedonobacteraceae bacterium]
MSETQSSSYQPVNNDQSWRAAPSLQGAEIGATILSPRSRGRQILRFFWRFGEIALAMLLGMGIFHVVVSMRPIPLGLEVSLLAMQVVTTIPILAWMRIRKYAWRLNAEMAGAMIVPTIVLIAAYALGMLPRASLMLGTHLLILPAMLAVMLYRWRDYTSH